MMPSFPKIIAMRSQLNLQTIHQAATKISPILGQINRQIQHEGASSTIHRFDATTDETQLARVGASLRIDVVKIEEFNLETTLCYLRSAAEQIAKGTTEHFIQEMNRITAQTGNVVNADCRKADEEMILESIEKMDHSFSPEGFWNPPTLFMSKETAAALLRDQSSPSNAFNERLNQILERKRDEFFSREASRVLVG